MLPLVEGIADAKPDFYDGSDQTTLEPQMRVYTISVDIRKQTAVESMAFIRMDPEAGCKYAQYLNLQKIFHLPSSRYTVSR